jgi:peptidoglycan/LPS O-acetylase OafA/YrhL
MKLTPQKSNFLNFIRWLSALFVVCGHTVMIDEYAFGPRDFAFYKIVGSQAHQAVVVFFVLSGFVISHAVDGLNQKQNLSVNQKMNKYFIDRFTRIYLVLIPVILLTILVDILGSRANLDLFLDNSIIPFNNYIFRIAANVLSLQGTYGYRVQLGSNPALWSIGYEFSYYIFFIILAIRPLDKKSILLIILFALVKGNEIMLYSLIWLSGVVAYKIYTRLKNSVNCYLVFGYFFVFLFLYYKIYPNVFLDKTDQNPFLSDFMFGLLLMPFLVFDFSFASKSIFSKINTFLADFSYSLYALHLPIIYLLYAILAEYNWIVPPIELSLLIILLNYALAILFGRLFESKKNLSRVRDFFYKKCKIPDA